HRRDHEVLVRHVEDRGDHRCRDAGEPARRGAGGCARATDITSHEDRSGVVRRRDSHDIHRLHRVRDAAGIWYRFLDLSRASIDCMRYGSVLSIIAACAVLAGCGGGGGGGGTPTPAPNADGDSVADAQDCAPNDATKWQLLPYQSIDMDQDGHR